MKKTIKNLVKFCICSMLNVSVKTRGGRYFVEQILSMAMHRTQSIQYRSLDLTFAVPNSINQFRIDTFATKEPETLEWIDNIPKGSVVWDVGANVGLYTCYAAKARGCRVFAFEPSVFNLEWLARNISLNGVTEMATIVSLPLSDVMATSTLNMTSTEWGGALSSFGQSYGQDGQALCKNFEFQTIGISMIDAVELLNISQPDYIKMDVDGIEHLILKGGIPILRNIKGILVEINETFEKQFVDSARYLSEAGLVLKEKRHADMFENSIYKNSYNQIWHRPLPQ
jgi:FkbM family methyltransferase